jgi:putative spermidine/putrescine transport system permease protein
MKVAGLVRGGSGWRYQHLVDGGLLATALLLIGLGFLVPLFFVVVHSLFPNDAAGPTLALYRKFLTDEYYLGILWRTLRIGFVAMVFALIPGYVLGYNIAFSQSAAMRSLAISVALVPLVVNLVIRLYGWITVLSSRGVLYSMLSTAGLTDAPLRLMLSETAITIGLVHSHITFMALTIAAALARIDPALLRAAQNLGASPGRVWSRVILPMSVPGIVAGSLIVFALNISDFVVPNLMGGNRNRMMTYLIYEQQLFLANAPFAAAQTVLLMLASAIAIGGYLRVSAIYARRFKR